MVKISALCRIEKASHEQVFEITSTSSLRYKDLRHGGFCWRVLISKSYANLKISEGYNCKI